MDQITMLKRNKETAFSAAFTKLGVRPEDLEFDVAIARYLCNGGTIERAHARIDAAATRLPGGHRTDASNGQQRTADRQFNSLGGQVPEADSQSDSAAQGTPIAGEDGHNGRVDQATYQLPPPREPTPEQLAAARKAREHAAKSIFDRVLTITGRAWGNITYRELREYARDGEFARELMVHIGSKTGQEAHKQIRELIAPQAFGMIARRCGVV